MSETPTSATPAADPPALGSGLDPVRFEVIRNALLAVTEEMGATLRRAAYSTNIKTRGDFSCAFFETKCLSAQLNMVVEPLPHPSAFMF